MRYIETTVVMDTLGQFGISMPEGAQVVAVERTGTSITLHHLTDADARMTDVDIAIAWSGMYVTPDMEYVGMYRSVDDRLRYVFLRRG